MARRRADFMWLRLEDIDVARCRPEFAASVMEDLRWLGIVWEGEVRVQSAHFADYQAALARLDARGLLYPCFCSRREIAAALGAPHAAELVYPGICRGMDAGERAARMAAEPYALRLDMDAARRLAGDLRFYEAGQGWMAAHPARFGDVVLARKDVPASYHLCVVHDDALQGVTHVVRGADLAEAAHLHVLLQSLLGLPAPVYVHHRLLTDGAGKRLAKRDGAATLRSMRAAGARPEDILAQFEEMTRR